VLSAAAYFYADQTISLSLLLRILPISTRLGVLASAIVVARSYYIRRHNKLRSGLSSAFSLEISVKSFPELKELFDRHYWRKGLCHLSM